MVNTEAGSSPISANNDFFRFLKGLAEISVVLGAGLFLIGWSYLYGYYHGFGLSAAELSFSSQVVVMHSLAVIEAPLFLIVTVGSVLILFLLSSVRILAFLRNPVLVLLLALTAIVTGSKPAGKKGRESAKRDIFLSTSTLLYVNLYGSDAQDYGGCDLADWNYRLLLRANNQIYVIVPIDNSGELAGANLRVCTFPESSTRAVRIQVGLGNK